MGKKILPNLSKRENEVLALVAKGLSSKEISKKLRISLKTVEVHRYNILKKTREKNTITLLRRYLENNIFIKK